VNFNQHHHAIPTTVDGIKFTSKKEAARYQYLKQFKAAGVISDFSMQPRYVLLEGYRKCCHRILSPDTKKCPSCGMKRPKFHHGEEYVADFLITMPDGGIIVEDVKGHIKTPLFNSKWKRFEYLFPELSLSIVTNVKAVPI